MITVPLSLDEETIKKVDLLVKKDFYKTRSEALRDQIAKGLERIEIIKDEFKESDIFQNLLDTMLTWQKPPNILKTEKTVAELVSEGRERSI